MTECSVVAIKVHSMYIDTTTSKRGSKVYVRHLLRESYREGGKVKHRTIANLSTWSDEAIAAFRLALKHKGNLAALVSLDDVEVDLEKSVGAVWALLELANRTGIAKALGKSLDGKMALMQVMSRVIDQGSRLSAVRLAERHAMCELLGIEKLDEEDLYENLGWLAQHQDKIEKRLFEERFEDAIPTLFLYDVTSSYLEGNDNELAAYGYNRDKKKGKKQIVVGLLAGPDGLPVAVRVFEGNTVDTKTVSQQVRILANTFGVKLVTIVGDRGMLKGPQIDALPDDFRFVTAISKPQIRKMLSDGILQLELFDDKVCEVESEGIRYILRRNPKRRDQMASNRESKLASIKKLVEDQTQYLADHPRAHQSKAVERVTKQIDKLNLHRWVSVTAQHRVLSLLIDEAARDEASLLDGCYVIKSDVSKDDADAQTLHDRYCDLEMLERSFRTMKTSHLELRPIFVRKKDSTRGHVFVVMLALLIQRAIESAIADLDLTVKEAIDILAAVHLQQMKIGKVTTHIIPNPTTIGQRILHALRIQLPPALPIRKANVHTKKKSHLNENKNNYLPLSPCPPPPSQVKIRCDNGIDDDCDGATDEGCTEIVVQRTSGQPPTIDGNLDEYEGAPELHVTNSETGSAGVFRFLWDDQALYVAVEVTDNNLLADISEHDGALWGDDAVELMFDTLHNLGAEQGADDYKIIHNILDTHGDWKALSDASWEPDYSSAVATTGTVNDGSDQDTGYRIELAIPWSKWGIAAPSSNDMWGLEVALDDKTGSGTSQAVWSNANGGISNDPDGWGQMRFSDRVVGEGCAEGETDCNGDCADLGSDPDHCGSCDHACEGGQECRAGQCVAGTDGGVDGGGADGGGADGGNAGGTANGGCGCRSAMGGAGGGDWVLLFGFLLGVLFQVGRRRRRAL